MRQRVSSAIALSCAPRLLIADEPTTALDVTIQAQYLELLKEVQASAGVAVILVTHDFGIVAAIADRVAVMYAGRIVELADVESLFTRPRHPYTEALLSAVPVPRPHARGERILLSGEVADPSNLPTGCAFHPRCRYAEARCREETPELRELAAGQFVRCHFAERLELLGSTG